MTAGQHLLWTQPLSPSGILSWMGMYSLHHKVAQINIQTYQLLKIILLGPKGDFGHEFPDMIFVS